MDILGQYKRERPEVFSGGEIDPYAQYSFYARLLMRLSGGRIKDERQVTKILVPASFLFLILGGFFFWFAFSVPSTPPSGFEGNVPDLPEYRNPPPPSGFLTDNMHTV